MTARNLQPTLAADNVRAEARAPEPQVTIERRRRGDIIAEIIERDYYDEPIRSFPAVLKRGFAHNWCARRDDVYFMTAEVGGEYAGFVFAHAMGDALFKRFARSRPLYFIPLVWTLLKMKTAARLARTTPEPESSRTASDKRAEEWRTLPELSNLSSPFAWSPADGKTGRIGLVFVSPSHRGRNLAPQLLKGVVREMAADGIESVEAHIDSANLSSVRTFLKAGWSVSRASGGDFLAQVEAPR